MSQYTSSYTTAARSVVNTILDTVTNTQTTTVVTAVGKTATVTYPNGGVSPDIARSLVEQLGVADPGIPLGLSRTTNDVLGQQASATEEALTTGNPPPEEKQAIPVPTADNPNPTPNPDVVVTPVRDAPPATTDPDVNNGAIGLGVDTATANSTVLDDGTDPYVSNGNTTVERLDTNTVVDDGTDPYVSNGQSTIPPEAQQTTSGYVDYRALYPQAQSDPYDELGKLNPGWTTDEFKTPYWVGFATSTPPNGSGNAIGVVKANAQATATTQDSKSFEKAQDWRVRISLAPNSDYLYNADSPGILAPLSGKTTTGTNGVIFPYTPNISVAYAASYDPTDIAHSNYKIFQYKSSSVDSISITGDFTAQDTNEANYLLAVIHFFRSVTKMFYGQDNNPKPGVPPPLCYLSGFGTYQFDNHPMVITNFTYTTPTDVDYIRAGSQTNMPGQSVAQQPNTVNTSSLAASAIRLLTSNLTPRLPNFQKQNSAINSDATYVPTKISIAITALPVVARNDISNRFSLEKYATGQLLQGSKNNGGGIW